MATLAEIAHFTKTIEPSNETAVVIADTSFLIGLLQDPPQCWLPEPSRIIENTNCEAYSFCIPTNTLDELDFNNENERKDKATGITKVVYSSDEVTKKFDRVYEQKLRIGIDVIPEILIPAIYELYALCPKKKDKELSMTDARIIASVYQYAKQGILSIALTDDRDIFELLNKIKETEPQLHIICASRFNLEKNWLYIPEDTSLITDLLLKKIMGLKVDKPYMYYVGVLKQQEWISFNNEKESLKNDIFAYLWQKTAISSHKKINDPEVIYYPLILVDNLEDKVVMREKMINRLEYDGIRNCGYVMFAVPQNPPKVLYSKLYTFSELGTEDIHHNLTELNLRRLDANFLLTINKPSLEKRIRL